MYRPAILLALTILALTADMAAEARPRFRGLGRVYNTGPVQKANSAPQTSARPALLLLPSVGRGAAPPAGSAEHGAEPTLAYTAASSESPELVEVPAKPDWCPSKRVTGSGTGFCLIN